MCVAARGGVVQRLASVARRVHRGAVPVSTPLCYLFVVTKQRRGRVENEGGRRKPWAVGLLRTPHRETWRNSNGAEPRMSAEAKAVGGALPDSVTI